MANKFDQKDLKSPDKLQAELQKGFQWTTQHSRLVGLSLLALLLIGAGVSAKSYLDDRKEKELQAKYFPLEKKLLEKKISFAAAAEAAAAPKDEKSKKTQPETPKGEKASGNFEQDYGSIAQDLMKLIDEAPESNAAKMAALNLSELQIQYGLLPQAQKTLTQVKAGNKDLLSAMVWTQLGTVQGNQNDCNGAISTWQKVLSNKKAKSLQSAVKLKQGLCYEHLKDTAQAEKLYTEASLQDKESATARAADKYLRLLQSTKKN